MPASRGGRKRAHAAAAGQVAAVRLRLLRATMPALLWVLPGLAPAPAHAELPRHAVQLRVERIAHEQLRIEGLRLAQVPGEGTAGHLALTARRLVLPGAGLDLTGVAFACELSQVADASDPPLWQCQGPLQWQGGETGWQLAWRGDLALAQGQLRLGRGIAEVQVDLPLAGRALAVQARRMPASWLSTLLPAVAWRDGRIGGRVELGRAGGQTAWRGHVQASGLAAETAEGTVAVEGVELSGGLEVRLAVDGTLSLAGRPTVTAGDVLVGPVFASWPAGSEIALGVDLRSGPAGIELKQLRLEDGDTRIEVAAAPAPDAAGWPGRLQVSGKVDLDRQRERLVEGTLAGLGMADLELSGQVAGSVDWVSGPGLTSLDADLAGVGLRHRGGAYGVEGLAGVVAMRPPGQPAAPVELAWQGLSLYGLALGPGRLQAQAADGAIQALAPVRLAPAGGELQLLDLRLALVPGQPVRLTGDIELSNARIDRLAAGFGWPAFPGRMDGSLPGLRLDRERLATGGGIRIEAFDGEARIEGLTIERPFGLAPALAADVHLRGLDLTPLTEVFGFGRIEGRLDGDIERLRLLGWRPVAFDARLRTRDSGRRRISQLAVDQLTRLGGGGTGLQGRLLGTFDSFGYRRIALGCRLANEVCTMSGLDEAAGGFTILQGSGLPLITIRGFQRQVDWPVLLERIRAAMAGQAPEVR
ncbi:MAG: hypothetical protein KF823_04595 [Xanthomonadales bacterium]|nr:hypothetical protein [Xanthomonadales bacterium]